MRGALGARGLSESLLQAVRCAMQGGEHRLIEERDRGGLAWMELPYRRPDEILKYVQAVEPRFDNVVVLGIGGSALGTIALSTALRPQYADLLPREARGGHPSLFVVYSAAASE